MRATIFVAAAVAVVVAIVLITRPFDQGSAEDPPKPDTTEQEPETKKPMDADARCWQLIEGAIPADGAGTEAHSRAILEVLQRLELEEIIAFDRFIRVQLNRAYRWDLWAVGYIAMGGCSDDGFEYFRLWVIAHGKEYFERALEDPQRAADGLKPGDEGAGWCEPLLYAAQEAYQDKTGGKELPEDDSVPYMSEPDGERWEEESVHKLYPELAKRFG